MPFMRRVLLSDTTYSSDAGTQVLKLPRSGALSGLMIRARMTNGATSGRAVSMLDVIDTIEVIANGSMPVLSLNSDELLRWQRYWTRTFSQLIRDEQAGAVQYWFLPVMFGRYMGDPKYWLPLNSFTDLELRVTYSPTIAADSGFATGTFHLEVAAFVMDGQQPAGYGGFFRTLNKYNNTTAASGDLAIEMPRGKPYRAIMVYVHESGIAMQTNVTRIKLELNDGAIVYGDWETIDLLRENHSSMSLDPENHHIAFSQGAETWETYLDELQSVQSQPGAVATIGTTGTPHNYITSVTGGLVTPQGIIKDGDGTQGADIALNADYAVWVYARGLGLGKAAVIDFGSYLEENTPWNSDQFSKVNLILTQGNAGAQVRVSLSELVQTL